MAGMRKLQTQSEMFWRDQYEVSEPDMDLVTSHILETGKPQPLSTLVSAIILRRYRHEVEVAARQARGGRLYQPMQVYEVGQEVLFSAMDFAAGRVTGIRPGRNPKYGPFDVIQVVLEGETSTREFVASFDYPHPLNRPVEELVGSGDEAISDEDMVLRFGPYVQERLETELSSREEFVFFNGMWFLRELLPEIHVGYLNLAEAIIEEAGHPLATREILKSLDLDAAGSTDAQVFALSRALGRDERFDRLILGDTGAWYLVSLQPEAVHHRPHVLVPAFRATGGEYVGLTMLDQIDEIGDELDDVGSEPLHVVDNVQMEISFPHLYAGTMPATLQFLHLLPSHQDSHYPIVMVDNRTSRRYDAWVVPQERYIGGLGGWYDAVEMCVGGQVSVSPTEEPLVYSMTTTPMRGRRSEWVRSASVSDGHLVLQMQRVAVAIRCDRNMLTDIPDRQAVADIMAQMDLGQVSLLNLLRTAFQELAKLSSKSIVHTKSLYAVVNMMRRSGAVPIFAELSRRACYDPVGDGFWAYDPSLEGSVYRTPEDMRERPLSTRGDVIKDQVVQYLGR